MSTEPDIPLSVSDLRGNEAAYLAQFVATNGVSSVGPFVVEMEAQLARLTGRAHGVAMVNGAVALHLVLVSAGSSGSGFHRGHPSRSEGFATLTATAWRSSTSFTEAGEPRRGYGGNRYA